MGESYIVRHCGFGIRSTDAILRVIAPAGSTVTITKDGVSKSDAGHQNADDSSLYDYYFVIHQSQFDSINPWTVTATLGTNSATDTIIVDMADEYDVELFYQMWLVKDGEMIVTFDVMGMKPTASSGYSAGAPTLSDDGSYITMGFTSGSSTARAGIVYATNKIDLSSFSSLRVVGTARNGFNNMDNLAVNAWTELGSSQDANRLFISNVLSEKQISFVSVDLTIDISSITNLAYVGINATIGSSEYSCIHITNMWLE